MELDKLKQLLGINLEDTSKDVILEVCYMSATAFQWMRREAAKKEIVNSPEIEKELSKMKLEKIKEVEKVK